MPSLKQLLWRALAVVSLALAIAGVVLPVLPTVPFLLLAAWAGGHGWPAFERWLLAHPRFGPPVRRWRETGAVPRRAKWFATVMMTASAAWILSLNLMPVVRLGVPLLMAGVATWLWMRPEP